MVGKFSSAARLIYAISALTAGLRAFATKREFSAQNPPAESPEELPSDGLAQNNLALTPLACP